MSDYSDSWDETAMAFQQLSQIGFLNVYYTLLFFVHMSQRTSWRYNVYIEDIQMPPQGDQSNTYASEWLLCHPQCPNLGSGCHV